MRIRINFTIDIPKHDMRALMRLAGNIRLHRDAMWFVRDETQDHILGYLNDNGVHAEVVEK